MQCFVSFFFSSLFFPFFLSFFFLTQCCWSFSCWLRIRIYSMSQGPEGGGGSFRVQSLMMTLWMYKYIYRRPERSRKQAQPLQALLSTCDCWDHYRDCGQAGKEKVGFFFIFWIMALFWVRGLQGGGRDADTHTHTHIHIHIRQPVSCEDWSLTAPSGVCMYVCVCECACVEQCKNDKVLCSVSGGFSISAGRGVKRRCSDSSPFISPQRESLARRVCFLSVSLPANPCSLSCFLIHNHPPDPLGKRGKCVCRPW